MVKRVATAVWQGSLKEGKGRFSAESGKLSEIPYSWAQRFGDEKGTNPEELIGAAHAACFSMASSAEMGKVGIVPVEIQTRATITMEKTEAGNSVVASHLDVTVKAPGADKAKLILALEAAKKGCPISRLLAPGLSITMTPTVVV